VLLVSHDRYFLDKLVDHVFAFEGNGVIKDFPGNYTEYRDWKDEQGELEAEEETRAVAAVVAEVAEETSIPEPPAVEPPKTEAPKRKLSFKEQRELELIEKELETMEARKKEIETLLGNTNTDHQELQKLSEEFSRISNSIDEKTMRWLELQD